MWIAVSGVVDEVAITAAGELICSLNQPIMEVITDDESIEKSW